MKISKIILFSLMSTSLVFTSCLKNTICVKGSGDTTTESRSLDSFTKLELNNAADVEIILLNDATSPYLVVEGETNLIKNLETKVRNNRLEIDEKRCVRHSSDLFITLYVNELNEVDINGSGNVYSQDTLKGDEFEIDIDGSGDIDLNLKQNELSVSVDGSGEIYLKGSVLSQSINIAGSGNYKAFGLTSSTAEVDLSGSGNINLAVSNTLRVTINGSGDVTYLGSPAVSSSVSGSGSVKGL